VIAAALETVGITEVFPIQQMTLPIALMGTDLIGQARTGTGKTLAFSVPLLQRIVSPDDPDYDQLAAPGKPQALVIAPTRELALQVAGDLALAGSKRGTRSVTVYGGVPYEPQLDALVEGVDIVVGTPGRLLDLVQRRALDLTHVKVLVLDEADEMLDLGFLPDVERLIRQTPEFRQTLLFSATMRGEVVALARTYMRHPVNITAEATSEQRTVPATAQFVYQTHSLDKPELLGRIMQAEDRGLTIVFTTTKRQAQQVADDLVDRGFNAAPLHGDMAQASREKAMARFRDGRVDILVATDVAARGIDVEAVTHVINYSCPDDEKTYLHRIGRTGRAGASGIAITFVDWADVTRWKVINNALDLPYEEVEETYSTSEHVRHELGIPRDATGRLKPPQLRDRSADARPSGGDRQRPDKRHRSDGRQRGRTRTNRSGSASASNERADRSADRRPADQTRHDQTEPDTESGERRRRRRTRQRTRKSQPKNS
jgi:superfamily II DNA/RNA helicase